MKMFMTYGAAVVAGVCLSTSIAEAVPVNYGDFAGSTVMFRDVTEDSATDPTPLFGAPTVAANSLDFNPTAFVSNSSNGSSDSTIAVLDFTMEATFGNVITNILMNERGDYTIFGAGGVGTSAVVSAPVFIDIVEVDNIAITPVQFNANLVFTPSNGDYNLQDDGAGFGVIWTGNLDIDVEQVLIDNNVPFTHGATEVKFIMNNILATTSEAGTQSNIQKKDAGVGITVVPEPASMMLLAAGMGLALRRK